MPRRVELLTTAIDALDEFMDDLDTSSIFCNACNRLEYVSFTEFKLHQEANAMLNKLKRWRLAANGGTTSP